MHRYAWQCMAVIHAYYKRYHGFSSLHCTKQFITTNSLKWSTPQKHILYCRLTLEKLCVPLIHVCSLHNGLSWELNQFFMNDLLHHPNNAYPSFLNPLGHNTLIRKCSCIHTTCIGGSVVSVCYMVFILPPLLLRLGCLSETDTMWEWSQLY